jgi:hypothetical protein
LVYLVAQKTRFGRRRIAAPLCFQSNVIPDLALSKFR